MTKIKPPRFSLFGFVLVVCASLALSNCQGSLKSYVLTGRVISKQPVTQQLIVDSDDIPGFMPPMAMPYTVKDPDGFKKAQPADIIRARIVVGTGNQFWIDHVVVTGKSAPPRSRPAGLRKS